MKINYSILFNFKKIDNSKGA